MRILCVIDWPLQEGGHWLWDYLVTHDDVVEFIEPGRSVSNRSGHLGRLLSYYPAFPVLAGRATRQIMQKEYDLVVAWEHKNGIPYAFLQRLLGRSGPPLLILAFSLRGVLRRMHSLARFAVKEGCFLATPTDYERDHYGSVLGFSSGRISTLRLGAHDLAVQYGISEQAVSSGEQYVFSGGHSYRDYRTFVTAVADLPVRVVINARPHNLKDVQRPANVQFNDLLPVAEWSQLMRKASVIVVPLQAVDISAGLLQVIYAMAWGKPLVVTDTVSTREYLKHGDSGLLVPPGDAAAMRDAVNMLLHDPQEAERLGGNARSRFVEEYRFDVFARRANELMHRVANAR